MAGDVPYTVAVRMVSHKEQYTLHTLLPFIYGAAIGLIIVLQWFTGSRH